MESQYKKNINIGNRKDKSELYPKEEQAPSPRDIVCMRMKKNREVERDTVFSHIGKKLETRIIEIDSKFRRYISWKQKVMLMTGTKRTL